MQTHFGRILQWVGVPILAAATLLPGLRAGPSLDAGVFGLVGRQIVDGATPYVEAWDHKPLGVHLVHALADVLPLLDAWVWTWALTLGSMCAASWLLVSMLRPVVSAPVAVAAGLGCAVGLGHFLLALGGGMSESFAVLPATAALGLAIRPEGRGWHSAVAGVLVGLAVIISPQLAASGVAVLLVLAGRSGVAAMTYLAGAALPVAVLVAGLLPAGALPAFLDAVVTYNAAYRAVGGPGFALLPWIVLVLAVLLAPAVAGLLALRRSSAHLQRLGLASLAWIAVAVALVALQGRLYGHYAIGIVMPLAVLAAIGAEDGLAHLRSLGVRVAASAIGIGLALLSLVVGAAGARMEIAMIEAVNARASAVATWAEREGFVGAPMLVWGNAPQVYTFNDSPAALRYGYLYPLTTPGYDTAGRVADALAGLEAAPPKLVIDAGSSGPGEPGFLPLLIDRPVATDGRDLDLLDPLRAFVSERYELLESVEGWPVYRLMPHER